MRANFQEFDFPLQRIPTSEKTDEWAARCADWIISQAYAIRDVDELERKYGVLQGIIPDEYYKKILNPYNATKEKYTRFPATMRNYDLISGIIRRYIGEYAKNPHEFTVGANNPEVVLGRNLKLRKEVQALVEQQVAVQIQQAYQEFVGQGGNPQEFNPQESIDIEGFTKKFNENYIDDTSAQGQDILNIIKDLTDDQLIYSKCYFDFVTFGECYTYTDVVNDKIIKRSISPRDAFPIPSGSQFREDDDMFCERRKMTYQQIVDEFDEYLTKDQREFLDNFYAKNSTYPTELSFHIYESYFPDICKKYNQTDRDLFKKNPIMQRDTNTDLYDVWHVVWRGDARKAVVTYVNENQMIDTRVETDDYKLNKAAGDISIEYYYEPQVYECVRIGTRNDAIYPYGARAIAYNRDGKLPYNGMNELFPGFGKFSIIEVLMPYQIFYNIVSYHREMTLAKNKLNVLMIAKSLLGKYPEDTIYKMIADGVLYIDDESDSGMLRAQQVRMLQSSISDYIKQLSDLLDHIREMAMEQVDMTSQRYGEIANSAGKAVTQEAINRGSMGSVILEYLMDEMREKDYARDMDYSKFAWIDGLNTTFRDGLGNIKYFSLNVENHNYADYVIKAKNSSKELEKLEQLKQFAFNIAQNGDISAALVAITGDNISTIRKKIEELQEQQQQMQQQQQQMEQQSQQMEQQFELQKIQAKGEEDRRTLELKGYIEQQIELIKADANMISFNADVGSVEQQEGIDRLNDERARVEREKLQLEKSKAQLDYLSKEKDRAVKIHDIDTKLKIAQTNKNKYDFYSPKKKTKKNKK